MAVSDALRKYLEAKLAGQPTDDLRKTLAQQAEELFETVRKNRQAFDIKWYENQRFMDGEHWLVYDRQSGKVRNLSLEEGEQGRTIRRSINLMKSQIRGLKNFVLKAPLTVEVSPAPSNQSPGAKQVAEAEARGKSLAWRAVENHLRLSELRRPVVDDGFLKHAGYVAVLPTSDGFVDVKHYDAYDVFPDPSAPAFYDGLLVFLATRQNLGGIKANKDYENTAELKSDGRLAASTFKNSYEQSRMGGSQQIMQGDLESIIWKQLFIKLPFTLEPVTEEQPVVDPATGEVTGTKAVPVMDQATGQPKQRIRDYEDGEQRIWILTFTPHEMHRVEETNFSRWPLVRYVPEQTGNRVHGAAWATDLQDPNRTVDNMFSKAEEWHIKSSPKLLVPADSKLKEVTNVTAEVLEYNGRTADGIRDYMPAGVPSSMQWLITAAQGFSADVGGMHPASGGNVPVSVKSGRGIEALQAADAEFNMAEPLENFGLFWKEVAERVFEVIAENTTRQRTLDFDDGQQVQRVTLIGESGLTNPDGTVRQAPPGTIVIRRKSHVRVRTVPEVAYSEDGKRETLRELFDSGAIDLQTLLEGYRFSNVGEIVERVIKERREKAQTPPPPPPVPADKLIGAIASLLKAGGPISGNQIEDALRKAGLPPTDIAALRPQLASFDTIPAGSP